MSDDGQPRAAREYSTWMWYVLPLLVVAAALSEMVLPECTAFTRASAAQPTHIDGAVAAPQTAPALQPGSPERVSPSRASSCGGSGRCESLVGLACTGAPDRPLGGQRCSGRFAVHY